MIARPLKLSNRRVAATSVEYATMVGLIACMVVGGMIAVRKGVQSTYEQAGEQLRNAPAGMTSVAGGSGTEKTVFGDKFDKSSLKDKNKWKSDGSGWSVQNGVLQAGGKNGVGKEHRLFAVGTSGSNYTVSADATLTKGSGNGLFFRASDGRLNGYSFEYDPGYQGGQFVMRKWVNGYSIWPPIAAASAPAGYQWYGTTRNLAVSASGTDFVGSVDGQVVLRGSDSTYARGQAGLQLQKGSTGTFDNFSITTRSR